MAKIQALIDAEAALAKAERSVAGKRREVNRMLAKASKIQREIDDALGPYREAASEAYKDQARSLTAWTGDSDALRHYRYHMARANGFPDRVWDRVAWVRKLILLDGKRVVSLQANEVGALGCNEYRLCDGPGDDKPIEHWLAEADKVLADLGWLLTEIPA